MTGSKRDFGGQLALPSKSFNTVLMKCVQNSIRARLVSLGHEEKE